MHLQLKSILTLAHEALEQLIRLCSVAMAQQGLLSVTRTHTNAGCYNETDQLMLAMCSMQNRQDKQA